MGVNEGDAGQAPQQHAGLGAVGAELARAREAKQLSVEAVAADLHLRPEIVRAIETGDEAELPAAAFARGYIKSYARLLGLDQAAIAAQLPDPAREREEPLKRVGIRRQRVSLPLGKWLVRGLLLLALVGLLIYGIPMIERLWTQQGAEPAVDPLRLPLSEGEEALDSLEMPESAPAPTPEPLPEPEFEPEAEFASEPEPAPAEPVPEAGAGAGEAPGTDLAAERTPAADTPADAAQTAAGPALVHLRFSEDSWVEMEANDRKLVVGTQRAGSERTVRAEPPVSILLGNAPGVELSYRGKPVDLAPYQRGKVARLTLKD